MIEVAELTDSSALVGDGPALRRRWEEDGVLFLRDFMDRDLIDWARGKYREVLIEQELIDPDQEVPLWTGKKPATNRPVDALGTSVWHEIVKQPQLNDVLREIFEGEPVWIPIVGHRSSMPSGPLKEGQDIFAGRHQDGFYNEGMNFTICWMPIRAVTRETGSFAVAPGTHRRGVLHQDIGGDDHSIPTGVVEESEWRTADFRVGDVLIFSHLIAHTTLPNPSGEIRMSLDVRAVPDWAAQPVVGEVMTVEGTDVTIDTQKDGPVTVHVDDTTYIRDMLPRPRVPTSELQRIAYPGASVLAMKRADGSAAVVRRNFY